MYQDLIESKVKAADTQVQSRMRLTNAPVKPSRRQPRLKLIRLAVNVEGWRRVILMQRRCAFLTTRAVSVDRRLMSNAAENSKTTINSCGHLLPTPTEWHTTSSHSYNHYVIRHAPYCGSKFESLLHVRLNTAQRVYCEERSTGDHSWLTPLTVRQQLTAKWFSNGN